MLRSAVSTRPAAVAAGVVREAAGPLMVAIRCRRRSVYSGIDETPDRGRRCWWGADRSRRPVRVSGTTAQLRDCRVMGRGECQGNVIDGPPRTRADGRRPTRPAWPPLPAPEPRNAPIRRRGNSRPARKHPTQPPRRAERRATTYRTAPRAPAVLVAVQDFPAGGLPARTRRWCHGWYAAACLRYTSGRSDVLTMRLRAWLGENR